MQLHAQSLSKHVLMFLRPKIIMVEKRTCIWNERRQEGARGDELEVGGLDADASCLAAVSSPWPFCKRRKQLLGEET